MKTEIITINEQGVVIFPTNGTVWMTAYEIARLFGVYDSAVNVNIRAIFKSGLLWISDVCKNIEVPKGYAELYNLEMVTALAFRIKSRNSEIFRTWLLKKATTTPIVIRLSENAQVLGSDYLN